MDISIGGLSKSWLKVKSETLSIDGHTGTAWLELESVTVNVVGTRERDSIVGARE